jgi:putative ABC transport system permease protein
VDDVKGWLALVIAVAVLATLVAFGNAAILMLTRAANRARELALRASLGASTGRLSGVLLGEGLIISLSAALIGIGLAALGLEVATAALPRGIPRAEDIAINSRVFAIATAIAIAAGLCINAVPVFLIKTMQPSQLLNQGSATVRTDRSRWSSAFVVVQVAMSSALLLVSTLSVDSFFRMEGVDLGFDRANLVAFEVDRDTDPAPIVAALARTPGVQSIAQLAGTSPPLVTPAYGGSEAIVTVRVVGGEHAPTIAATLYRVSPASFSTAGIRRIRGRDFDDADTGGYVAIIDESAARRLFSDGRDPIGAVLSRDPSTPDATIIGVVQNVRAQGPERDSGPQVYLPKVRESAGTAQFLV